MKNFKSIYLSVGIVFWAACLHAQQLDPHDVYEQNCAACHSPHAGEFVGETLISTSSGLAGKSSARLVRDLLDAGHGKLSDEEIDTLVKQFEFIHESGALFREKCIICHDNAARFARLKLIMRDDKLTGRYSDRDIADFLLNHGRLDASEVQMMVKVLTRQLMVR